MYQTRGGLIQGGGGGGLIQGYPLIGTSQSSVEFSEIEMFLMHFDCIEGIWSYLAPFDGKALLY